jgi:hypothetical protein
MESGNIALAGAQVSLKQHKHILLLDRFLG